MRTLKEKFINFCDHEYANREDNAENCIDVADDYAIGFAIWCSKLKIDNWEKELLEIYKKEKGL